MSKSRVQVRVQGIDWDCEVEEIERGHWTCSFPGLRAVSGKSQDEVLHQIYGVIEESIGEGKSTHQIRVEKFMRLIAFHRRAQGLGWEGQELPTSVGLCDRKGLELRARLILEECIETVKALGMSLSGDGVKIVDNGEAADLVGIVDGCFDVMVVTTGTLSCLGVPDLEGQRIVDENNLTKFSNGFSIREDGKLIKPPGFVGPDIESFLKGIK